MTGPQPQAKCGPVGNLVKFGLVVSEISSRKKDAIIPILCFLTRAGLTQRATQLETHSLEVAPRKDIYSLVVERVITCSNLFYCL